MTKETKKAKRKARFIVKPFQDSIDEITIKALEKIAPRKKVVLHYSTGKDSISCWLFLRELGYEVFPVFKQILPLSLFSNIIKAHEEFFGTEIFTIPYKGLYLTLKKDIGALDENFSEKFSVLAMEKEIDKGFHDLNISLINHFDADCCIVGVKSGDSLSRCTSFQMTGPYNAKTNTFYPCWRLSKNAPLDIIVRYNCPLPKYYLWLGRSPNLLFDSEYWFIKKYFPEDWKIILKHFPDADIKVVNFENNPKIRIHPVQKKLIKLYEGGYPFI